MSDLLERLGRRYPIWNAGMGGGIAGPELAAAVSNAGGFGVVGTGGMSSGARHLLDRTRSLTSEPFGANIILPVSDGKDVQACMDARVSVLILFWGDPQPYIGDAHRRGIAVVLQCGGTEEAVAAANSGVDAVILQGIEAGGHVKAISPLADTLKELATEIGATPVIAAGGIATRRDVESAFRHGARAVSVGTRFVASIEAAAHGEYKKRIVAADSADTVLTELYDIGWERAPHRVIRTGAYERWVAAGRPDPGSRPGEGENVGTILIGSSKIAIPRYSFIAPLESFDGDLDAMPLYAGKSVDRVAGILPVADIIRDLVGETVEGVEGTGKRLLSLTPEHSHRNRMMPRSRSSADGGGDDIAG